MLTINGKKESNPVYSVGMPITFTIQGALPVGGWSSTWSVTKSDGTPCTKIISDYTVTLDEGTVTPFQRELRGNQIKENTICWYEPGEFTVTASVPYPGMKPLTQTVTIVSPQVKRCISEFAPPMIGKLAGIQQLAWAGLDDGDFSGDGINTFFEVQADPNFGGYISVLYTVTPAMFLIADGIWYQSKLNGQTVLDTRTSRTSPFYTPRQDILPSGTEQSVVDDRPFISTFKAETTQLSFGAPQVQKPDLKQEWSAYLMFCPTVDGQPGLWIPLASANWILRADANLNGETWEGPTNVTCSTSSSTYPLTIAPAPPVWTKTAIPDQGIFIPVNDTDN